MGGGTSQKLGGPAWGGKGQSGVQGERQWQWRGRSSGYEYEFLMRFGIL